MGFDTRMISGGRACSTSTRPTHPTITNQTSPHLAEALVLEALGWSVLRYWNHEVLSETDRVVAEVRSFITLRSPTTTTTSPTAS
jgi:hypothetical protein